MMKLFFFEDLGGEFSAVFYIAAVLFFVCTLSTLTSVREEPLISSSSSSENVETEEDDDDNNGDDNPEVGIDEGRPLLPIRRNGHKSYSSTSTKPPVRSTSSIVMNSLNHREGFIEIDPSTGSTIPHDHVEQANGDVLLKTLEQSHQLVAATMSNNDPSNPTSLPSQAFDAELRHTAKLVKLGIYIHFIHFDHFLFFYSFRFEETTYNR